MTTSSSNPESNISTESAKVVISGAKTSAAASRSGFVSATAVSRSPSTALIAWLCSSPIAP